MAVIQRDQNWVDGEVLFADVLDEQFDKVYNLLAGLNLTGSIFVRRVTSFSGADAAFVAEGGVELGTSVNGRVFSLWKVGESNPRIDFLNTGQIKTIASQQGSEISTQMIVLKGTLVSYIGPTGNVGSGEDDLTTFIIGQHTLTRNRHYIDGKYRGFVAANANNKRIKFYCKNTVILDTGVITENNVPFFIDFEAFIQEGLAQVIITAIITCGATVVRAYTTVTGYDPAIDNTWKITGEGVATNDIVLGTGFVEKGFV